MWSLFRPSDARVRRFLAEQSALPFSYPDVGATATTPPAGYVFDHNRARLGTGVAAFDAGREALRRWRQFPRPWTTIHPPDAPITSGTTIVVVAHVLGVWWLNAARVVTALDEPRAFGLAYGTLPGHVESGEERFVVEWLTDDTVWYDLRAFSRPRHPLVRLGYPLTRRQQRRFARESLAAMRAVTSGPSAGAAP